MRRRLHTAVLGALAVLLTATVPAGLEAQARAVMLPLFDLETASHSLAVSLTEEVYGEDAVYAWSDVAAQIRGGNPRRDLTTAVLAYLDLVVNGETGRLGEFLPDGANNKVEAEQARVFHFMLGQLGTPESVRFLRLWYFGNYRVVLLRVTGDKGKSAVYTVSLHDEDGRFVLDGNWGRYEPVQSMFWYAAGNFQQGLVERHRPRTFTRSVELQGDVPQYPLTLHFDGTVYAGDDATGQGAATADPATPAGLLARTLAVAASDDDVQFLELWKGDDKLEVLELQRDSPALYEGLKDELSATGVVRHVLTADLGEYAVHYFAVPGESSELHSVVLRRAEGRFWLTRELYSNVATLMRSDLLKEKLRDTSDVSNVP